MPDVSPALRREVRARARNRCEYCLLPVQFAPLPHEIDHVIAIKHAGHNGADNLAWCCLACNRYKGSDISSIDPILSQLERLFNPRTDAWSDHFKLNGGEIESLTGIGRATAQLLKFNATARVHLRLEVSKAGLLNYEGAP